MIDGIARMERSENSKNRMHVEFTRRTAGDTDTDTELQQQ
jgi:hypothetical protein